MPSSSKNAKLPQALALKQAAGWQCKACGRHCRRHDESLDEFAVRIGNERDAIAAHPRRWTLHLTKVAKHSYSVLKPVETTASSAHQAMVVLCGSCHRTYHNYHRWQHRQQQHRQQQERFGQLTLNDIRLPLTGLQLSFTEWSAPYEIVNPLPPQKRIKSRRNPQ
ncbi:hypothetical protein N836_04755 [Leptolyngbya sp. Heron Island J]|uniref:hypothetical protein n=1 Tax=Leptolyngbya sp. Heron Island J TaxID=1385935 RepID=UPI0003B99A63|nr:hypothetical protein [Leptolyngbya sp. Heron Island J]ESA36872.1 hypothetical protein N836_04755 [Leptolyngbya sp. Heron Island J]